MSFDLALRGVEILTAFALIQQSIEHLRDSRTLAATRIAFCLLLLSGLAPAPACAGLFLVGVAYLHRFDGPYNGGCDRMSLLILLCLTATHLLPEAWKEPAFGYLAMQLILSYVISGWVKIRNPEWRTGRALRDVFAFSAYPVSERLRGWADRPRTLLAASWAVMLFELAFPIFLTSPSALWLGLAMAAGFHLANACLFGLNRFLWIWIAAYPSLLWLQDRLFG
jgi:hypothetical protein